ncbi:MAG: molybdopterin-dependent oxidoreductase [Acidimicrobiia bacterium]|nr:molybdopterin-dependent oxidoreductase [Acidimicrobiia bacterium]
MALPPGQIETRRFPVVGERAPSPDLDDPARWQMTISGLVNRPTTLTLDAYLSLATESLEFDIHCVTSWSRLGSTWRGVPLRTVLDVAEPLPDARFVSFTAYSTRGHHTSLPLDIALEFSWLVHEFEGERLTPEHGGPVRVVTPGRYFYKSLKWVKEVELRAEDRLGWWETNSSYHNNADPWPGDERFTTGSLRPEQLERFLSADRYDKYRGKVMLGLDLTSWEPAGRDLHRLYLKMCDLRGVDLSGSDLHASNLSLSDLTGANLRRVNLAGSDLEGADFTDADLTEANMSGTALSATRFDGATVAGTTFEGSWGLLESQQRYLVDQGIDLPGY